MTLDELDLFYRIWKTVQAIRWGRKTMPNAMERAALKMTALREKMDRAGAKIEKRIDALDPKVDETEGKVHDAIGGFETELKGMEETIHALSNFGPLDGQQPAPKSIELPVGAAVEAVYYGAAKERVLIRGQIVAREAPVGWHYIEADGLIRLIKDADITRMEQTP
jgi:translation elongation factor EF-G